MSATVATLRAMRVRLGVKERWTKYAQARDAEGQPVKPEDPAAVCWCLDGAAVAEADWQTTAFFRVGHALFKALRAMGTDTPYYEWQDRHTHAEMLHLIDRAIELTEAAQ